MPAGLGEMLSLTIINGPSRSDLFSACEKRSKVTFMLAFSGEIKRRIVAHIDSVGVPEKERVFNRDSRIPESRTLLIKGHFTGDGINSWTSFPLPIAGKGKKCEFWGPFSGEYNADTIGFKGRITVDHSRIVEE